jgi:cation diffusion facilitator family transporter
VFGLRVTALDVRRKLEIVARIRYILPHAEPDKTGMTGRKEKVAIVSAIASGSLAAAKLIVGVAIGSLALISDALHSVIDLGATLVTWYAVRAADRPPDEEHHYGPGKIESVAALAASALLLLVAGGVAVEGVTRLQRGGSLIQFSIVPFVVLGIEMAVNGWRARVLLRVAHETKSQALEADSLHFASDFFGSIPVIIGLVLSGYGFAWGDPVAALVVAVLIAFLGVRMARRTVATLLDAAPAGAASVIAGAARRVPGVVAVEQVRARGVGETTFVDLTVAVSRTLPLDRVLAIKNAVSTAIQKEMPGAEPVVVTHPVALSNETVLDRVMVIARNRALAVHHVTVHELKEGLTVSLDLEVDGRLSLRAAHDMADGLERAVEEELGSGVEVETHIEPLQPHEASGREAPPERVRAVSMALAEIAAEGRVIRDVHDVRVRETDEGEIVNFHCRVDPELTVQTVHESVDALERTLKERSSSIKRVIGHAEPMR